jgi:hypothetical protein
MSTQTGLRHFHVTIAPIQSHKGWQRLDIPTREQAEKLLKEAGQLNPGPWVRHSQVAAEAAFLIAERVPGMDAEGSYILGLLHDIGRRYGVYGMRHITDGFGYMESLGYSRAARICITHSFPLQDPRTMLGWDGTPEEEQFVYHYIASNTYDDYDRLIQLADALALPNGCCLIEKRMVDVSMRYGFNDFTIPKWKAHLAILRGFEEKIGMSIYSVLPNVIETTFGEGFQPQTEILTGERNHQP